MDAFLEALLSTPLWTCTIAVLALVLANLMSKRRWWHNAVLVVAWGLCTASVHFSKPFLDWPQHWRVAMTATVAICSGLLFWLCREPLESSMSKKARKVVSRATKLLRKIHHLHPLNVLRQAGAATLSNKEIIAVSDAIAKRNYGSPFSDVIPKADYLSFLEFSLKEPLPLGTEPEIYDAMVAFHLQSPSAKSPAPPPKSDLCEAMDGLEDAYKELDGLMARYYIKDSQKPTIHDSDRILERMRAGIRHPGIEKYLHPNDPSKLEKPERGDDFLRLKTEFWERGYLEWLTDTEKAVFDDLLGKSLRLKELILKIKSSGLS